MITFSNKINHMNCKENTDNKKLYNMDIIILLPKNYEISKGPYN